MVEWSILLLVVLVLMGVFGRQVRVVQGQGELAAIKSTLAALRMALVIDHLQQSVQTPGAGVAAQQRNPFLLLKGLPANYAGEVGLQQIDAVAPGSWVFDADCGCIGYRPLYPQWLESPVNTQAVWFKVGAASGPAQITAMQVFVWQGQVVD